MLNTAFARVLEGGGGECMHWLSCYECHRLGDDCDGNESIFDLEEGDKVYYGRFLRRDKGRVVPIVWDVLNVDGKRALLASKEILSFRPFDEFYDSWTNSNTRRWLNNDFLNEAFNKIDELLPIQDTEQPDKGTTDKVFLLDDETVAMWVVWDD